MKVKEGDKFLCTKTVVMNPSGEEAFIEGRVYTSEKDGCLTNEQRIKDHHVNYSIDPIDSAFLSRHFTPWCGLLDTYKNRKSEGGYKESSGKLNYELDFDFITQMAERMDANKGKYQPYNWQKPHDITGLKQALFRHVLEIMKGNYDDEGREYGHLESISLNAMMINYQLREYGKDRKNLSDI